MIVPKGYVLRLRTANDAAVWAELLPVKTALKGREITLEEAIEIRPAPARKPAARTSGSVGLAAPLCLAAVTVFGTILAETKIDNATALLIGSAVLAAAMVIPSINIVVGWIKGKPAKGLPSPLIIKEAKTVATTDDLDALEVRLNTQWEERFEAQNAAVNQALATNNAELHRLATNMNNFSVHGHNEREGIHNRLNPLAEKTAEINAKLSLLLTHILPPTHPSQPKEQS